CRQAGDPGTTTEDRPGAWAGGYGMCSFALILLSLGWTNVTDPVPPGSSITGPSVAGKAFLRRLATQTEALDERPVAGDVGVAQVGQQATTTANQEQQAPAAVVVVLVHLEVLIQVVDPAGHERDLDLRRTGVTLSGRVIRKDLLLDFSVERHVAP